MPLTSELDPDCQEELASQIPRSKVTLFKTPDTKTDTHTGDQLLHLDHKSGE